MTDRDSVKVQKIIDANRRVLVGLAHYDNGARVKGCDCCYCAPEGDA
jgi:hypothetical protein